MKRSRWIVPAIAVLAATALALSRSKRSWVRLWDFPRLQVALLGTATLAGSRRPSTSRFRPGRRLPRLLEAALAAATIYQWLCVWRYTPLAPRETERALSNDADARLSIVEANVLQDNRDVARLVSLLRERSPDIIVCVETDRRWCEALAVFAASHPYRIAAPLDNTYGMVVMSRLPLEDGRVEYLTDPEIPSITARVVLRNETRVRLHCVHPRPPSPDKADTSLQRDSELAVLGRRVAEERDPVVVCGDLNDVAWSRTTRLFQRLSGLLDPRRGRGFFSTFSAYTPGLRFPLDHVFHSKTFRLVSLEVLPSVGSDHLPMHVVLSHEPHAAASQEAPQRDADDEEEADKTLREHATESPP